MTIVAKTPRFGHPVYAHWSQAPWDKARWPNFSAKEIACKRTGKVVIVPTALDRLQELRTKLGKPFYVTSGYRSPEHNATLSGAAAYSFHMDGIAFDISMRNHDPHVFKAEAQAVGFQGIGTYPGARGNFIHIDTRGSVARWGDPFPGTAPARSAPVAAPAPSAKPNFKSQPTRVSNIAMIKQFEGLRLKAYMPTPNDVPTIGYGHTHGVRMGMVITEKQAEEFLRQDLAWARAAVAKEIEVPLSQEQYDALVSFTFNVGAGALKTSTLRRKLNAYDYVGAAAEFPRWNKQAGKPLAGLTVRRAHERDLFLKGTK